ncbi:MAG: MmgE/PrpD family protein [Burkholderiales bacterium]|nr:MmgE/PrpD family protein [Burkholderiales bacterium]
MIAANNITLRLAETIAKAASVPLPGEAIETARACLLDTLGVAIPGSREPLVAILDEVQGSSQAARQSTLWFRRRRIPTHEAALINGAAAHALDFDDMHIESAMHPSAPVVAAALALAETQGTPGALVLRAIALGIEAELRIGMAVNPSHYQRGWHATATLGHFGSAVAAAHLLGLDPRQTVAALGIAGTQSGGLKETFGSMTKPLHAGIAARNGVTAALLAVRGFTSAADILGGPNGFGHVMCDAPVWDFLLEDWNAGRRPWAITEILYKTHASSFCTQALIEAVLDLRAKHGLQARDVTTMRGEVGPLSIQNAPIPEPVTGLEAKFSLPHAMAQAVAYGHARVADFSDDRVREPLLRDLRTVAGISENATLAWPEAIATLHLVDGRQLSSHVDLRRRTATAADKWAVVEAKFMELATGLVTSEDRDGIIRAVRGLDTAQDLGELLAHVQG